MDPDTADRERPVSGARRIVNSIPWTAWAQAGPLPEEVRAAVGKLVQVPIDVDYCADTLPSDSHWTYDPDESKSFHRLLLRANFCPGSRGYWTETNSAAFARRQAGGFPPPQRVRLSGQHARQTGGRGDGHAPGRRRTASIRSGAGASGST